MPKPREREIYLPMIGRNTTVSSGSPTGGSVPVGGTTGQVLAKKSNADYDTEWDDAGTGGGLSHQQIMARISMGF
jgi:hypothetical protein